MRARSVIGCVLILALGQPITAMAQAASQAAHAPANQPSAAHAGSRSVPATDSGPAPSKPAATQPTANLTSAQRLALRRTPVVRVFQARRQAVVNIASTRVIQVQSPFGSDADLDELFNLPLHENGGQELTRTSVGSGFVIHPTGYVLTNAHVVARTADRKVIFGDEQEFDAQVVAIDLERDLAVLKIDPGERDLQALPLGRSDDLLIGETVVAIGNPLGMHHTVTAGVVSATDRDVELRGDVVFQGLIQTDAAINPGNSGGPLLNVFAELVGVNTAVRTGADRMGFAVPVDQVRAALPNLLDVERRYRIRTGLKLQHTGSAVVQSVGSDSPAERIGIQPGDRITHIDGTEVTSAADFYMALIGREPGEDLSIVVQRPERGSGHGSLTLDERPAPDGGQLLQELFGITAVPLDPQTAQDMGLAGMSGLLVEDVEPESPAEDRGMQGGDLIVQIGRYQPQSLKEVGELLESVKSGQPVGITVLRGDGRVFYRSTVLLKAR